jgi:hypothetical protein
MKNFNFKLPFFGNPPTPTFLISAFMPLCHVYCFEHYHAISVPICSTLIHTIVNQHSHWHARCHAFNASDMLDRHCFIKLSTGHDLVMHVVMHVVMRFSTSDKLDTGPWKLFPDINIVMSAVMRLFTDPHTVIHTIICLVIPIYLILTPTLFPATHLVMHIVITMVILFTDIHMVIHIARRFAISVFAILDTAR